MIQVTIAKLKAGLSEYLRAVRRGERVTILHHTMPVARIVPYEERGGGLEVHRPARGAPRLADVRLPDPLEVGVDVVDLLLEERQGKR